MQLNLKVIIAKTRAYIFNVPWNPKLCVALNYGVMISSSRSMATNVVENHGKGLDRRRDLFQVTKMIAVNCRLGRLEKARHLFDEMPLRDTAAWNAMIKGCIDCGELQLAQDLFGAMPKRNVISWTTMVDGLARCGSIAEAEELFLQMPQRDTAAWNSMISGYCGNGRIDDALALFGSMKVRNVITWTAMISGLDQNGRSREALSVFQQLLASPEDQLPTFETYTSALSACSNVVDTCPGSQLHARIVRSGVLLDTFVSTSLITFYARCKQMESSKRVLEELNCRSVASWTALITGFGLNGDYRGAVAMFECMTTGGIVPNQSTFTSVLNSCGELEELGKGREIHGSAVKLGFGRDSFVGNSLIFMYSKCGEIEGALMVFGDMEERNIITWNSIIIGCAHNGHGMLAFGLYKDMVLHLMLPDEITFVGLLTACSHCKMVGMAKHLFHLLHLDGSLEVRLEHYICMVDVLGRSGKLEEAEDLINRMPLEPDKVVWLSLLSACRGHPGQLEIARQVAEKILDLEPSCSAAYTLLSNMYASEDQWDDVSLVRSMMRSRNVEKRSGNSELH